MSGLSIRFKMVVGVLIVMALGAGGIALVLQNSYSERVDLSAREAVVSAQSAFSAIQQGRTEKLLALMDALSADAEITTAFESRDREGLAAVTRPRFDMLKERQGLNRWYFYMPEDEGTVFLRAYKGDDALDPEEWGDETDRATYWQAVESKQPVSGFELGRTALALRAAQPYYNASGEIIGYMAVGEEIGEFLALAAQQTGDDYAFFLHKEAFDAESWADARDSSGLEDNWGDLSEIVLADSTSDEGIEWDGSIVGLDEDGEVLSQETIDGRTYVRGVFPVVEAGGDKVAAVLVTRDVTDSLASLRAAQTAVLLWIGGLVIAVALIIIVMLNSLIFSRLKAMIANMENLGLRIAGGDFDAPLTASGARDEIGQFEKFFVEFVGIMAGALKKMSSEQDR